MGSPFEEHSLNSTLCIVRRKYVYVFLGRESIMKKRTVFVIALLAILVARVEAAIWLEDGQVHEISNVVSDSVYVKNAPDQVATTLRLLDGGSILSLETYGHSQIEIEGGIIGGGFQIHDSSVVTMTSGYIHGGIDLTHWSELYMTGGDVLENLRVSGTAIARICGGNIHDLSVAGGDAVVSGGFIDGSIGIRTVATIIGRDFTIDGEPVGFGRYDWLDLVDPMNPSGGNQLITLGGVLANGDVIDNVLVGVEPTGGFILIPEPTTVLLLGLGGLMLRRKR